MHPAGQRPALQRQSLRLRLRQHLQGPDQGPVRPGAELLLLPRGGGLLPPGGFAERPERHAQQAAAVHRRGAAAHGPGPGAADLRLPLPLRADPGAVTQDPRAEDPEGPVEPPPVLAEIRRAGGVCGGPAPVVRLRPGPAGARLLQVHLPGGDPGGGPPPVGPPAGVPGPGGVAVHLEGGPVRRHPPGVHLPVPGLLPLPVPPGGHLLPLLPGGPAGLPGGRREVRRLRPVRAPVPHGRGAGGGPGVYPVRRLPPNLPQRGHLFWLGKEQIP